MVGRIGCWREFNFLNSHNSTSCGKDLFHPLHARRQSVRGLVILTDSDKKTISTLSLFLQEPLFLFGVLKSFSSPRSLNRYNGRFVCRSLAGPQLSIFRQQPHRASQELCADQVRKCAARQQESSNSASCCIVVSAPEQVAFPSFWAQSWHEVAHQLCDSSEHLVQVGWQPFAIHHRVLPDGLVRLQKFLDQASP